MAGVLGWQYSYTDLGENTGRVMFAKNTASSTTGGQRDDTLDHSYDYDHLGRLSVSHTGYEARLHMSRQQPGEGGLVGVFTGIGAKAPYGDKAADQDVIRREATNITHKDARSHIDIDGFG